MVGLHVQRLKLNLYLHTYFANIYKWKSQLNQEIWSSVLELIVTQMKLDNNLYSLTLWLALTIIPVWCISTGRISSYSWWHEESKLFIVWFRPESKGMRGLRYRSTHSIKLIATLGMQDRYTANIFWKLRKTSVSRLINLPSS